MSVRIQIVALYRGPEEALREVCGRPVKTSGEWRWSITDPLHRPFPSTDLSSLPSVSFRVFLEDGDWMMEIFSGGSLILKIRDREANAAGVADALGRSGLPVASQRLLADALEHKNLTEGEKRWPVGTLPRVLELLDLKEIFPNWREEIEQEMRPVIEEPPPSPKVEPDPNALYNGRSGWFQEIDSREIPAALAQAAADNGFTPLGMMACSKWVDLRFAVFRHLQKPVYVVYELEFGLTLDLISSAVNSILVTCNHAYPVMSNFVIPQMMPGRPLKECLSRHLEKLNTMSEIDPPGALLDFCVLYDRYICA